MVFSASATFRVTGQALVEVASLQSHSFQDLRWEHVPVLDAEKVGRMLGLFQGGAQLCHI